MRPCPWACSRGYWPAWAASRSRSAAAAAAPTTTTGWNWMTYTITFSFENKYNMEELTGAVADCESEFVVAFLDIKFSSVSRAIYSRADEFPSIVQHWCNVVKLAEVKLSRELCYLELTSRYSKRAAVYLLVHRCFLTVSVSWNNKFTLPKNKYFFNEKILWQIKKKQIGRHFIQRHLAQN